MNKSIQQYRQLRGDVDQTAAKLEKVHAEHMQCGKGCCGCCMNFSIWPVEFYSILGEMKAANRSRPVLSEDAECGFLDKEDGCQIYPFRPVICRTHGLPLAYWHDETDPPGWGIMFCEQNFTKADEIEFGPDTTLNMDEVNEQLAYLNITFLEENKDLHLKPTDRIQLKELLRHY